MSTMEHDPKELLSVGRVAEQTGLSPDSLRIWERRYGVPKPVRLPSGHRRFTRDQVSWLRRVAEALALGYRPGRLMKASKAELEELIAAKRVRPKSPPHVVPWIEMVKAFAADDLRAILRDQGSQLPPLELIERHVFPLVQQVGLGWAEGELDVRHEHFVSEIVEDVLRSRRGELETRNDHYRAALVLATLPEEAHGLGLQMAALICESNQVRSHLLGTDAPIQDILAAIEETGADGVALSVSLSSGGVLSDRRISALRKAVPDSVRVIVGGEGVRRVRRRARDIDYFLELREFDEWLRESGWLRR